MYERFYISSKSESWLLSGCFLSFFCLFFRSWQPRFFRSLHINVGKSRIFKNTGKKQFSSFSESLKSDGVNNSNPVSISS
ncbi:hypothetical protein JavanS759_0002 [Streptococcus satellite phage Javan759]|nr:hypothetical protein JavanS759_0002 [Streptococcus satellite phage Javan759]